MKTDELDQIIKDYLTATDTDYAMNHGVGESDHFFAPLPISFGVFEITLGLSSSMVYVIMPERKPHLPSDGEADVPFPNPLFLYRSLKQRCCTTLEKVEWILL